MSKERIRSVIEHIVSTSASVQLDVGEGGAFPVTITVGKTRHKVVARWLAEGWPADAGF